MKRLRFLQGIASAAWAFDPGQVAELPDHVARDYLLAGIAVEVNPSQCPHCGHELQPATPPGPEAAALALPRRRG